MTEEDKNFYNEGYKRKKIYLQDFTAFPLLGKVWNTTIKILIRNECLHIVELGAGAGNFAELLVKEHKRILSYTGYDFSSVGLQIARKRVFDPRFKFLEVDLKTYDFQKESSGNSTYVMHEFLEHISNDLDILRKIPFGSLVILSVPSFLSKGHVRYFNTFLEVKKYYGFLLDINSKEFFPLKKSNHGLYLLSGIKI